MNKIIHKADSRGSAEHGWLHSFHTFSFADYYDRERMGFGKLWVLNDDVVQAGQGFGTHSHDNMEIISIPLSGSLRHEDSMGNSYVIRTGEIQVMSAGSGITHSEFNNSDSDEVNFLQIWVMPAKQDVRPHSDQKYFDPAAATNRFQLVVSPDGRDGSLVINQDAYFSLAFIGKGETVTCDIHTPGNGVYVFVLDGEVEIAGEPLQKRDAIGLENKDKVIVSATRKSRILCMEVPMH